MAAPLFIFSPLPLVRHRSSSSTEKAVIASCRPRTTITCHTDNKSPNTTPSRRTFITMLTTALITTTTPLHALSDTPTRTIFDEERELFEKRQTEAAEARVSALRAAFEAVEKSEAQLDDVPKFVSDKDWNGVRKFSRLFNNSVEREGMEGIAKKLDLKEVRKDALALCKQVSKELQQLDRLAGREEGDAVLKQAEHVKELVASFQRFKP